MIEPNNIYLGDCYDLLMNKCLNGKKICIVTDPPFNVGYHYKTYKDNLNEEEYIEWLCDLLTLRNCPFVIIHYPEMLYKISFQVGIFPDKVVSWVYNSNTAKQHRDIAFFGIMPDFSKVRQPYKNLNDRRIKARIEKGIGGGRLYDWWNINQVKNVSSEKYNHPCIMPLEVMENIVGILPDDYTIVDPFMGSGTTMKACINLNRDFYGSEIEPEYYQIAIDRLNNINAKGEVSLF